jgi:hypothetical protein
MNGFIVRGRDREPLAWFALRENAEDWTDMPGYETTIEECMVVFSSVTESPLGVLGWPIVQEAIKKDQIGPAD